MLLVSGMSVVRIAAAADSSYYSIVVSLLFGMCGLIVVIDRLQDRLPFQIRQLDIKLVTICHV